MIWALFIDDLREPPGDQEWVVCRSTEEAIAQVRIRGMPSHMSLDHDLGGDDTTMEFLRQLTGDLWDGISPPPSYRVHSANPVGAQNIVSFMESWRRSLSLNSNSGETNLSGVTASYAHEEIRMAQRHPHEPVSAALPQAASRPGSGEDGR